MQSLFKFGIGALRNSKILSQKLKNEKTLKGCPPSAE